MTHYRSLDGMRGVAILLVILFHYNVFGAGWVGVQMFFVLSGFLITGILLKMKGQPLGASLRTFYSRRALRIFPLYYLYLIGLVAVYVLRGEPDSIVRTWPTLVTYTFNLTRASSSWEFSPFFDHLWSLCVEEQFYLVWPIVVLLLPMNRLKWVIAAAVCVAPVMRAGIATAAMRFLGVSEATAADAVYWCTLSQIDAFALGAGVAVFNLASRIERPGRLFGLSLAAVIGLGIISMVLQLGRGMDVDFTTLGYGLLTLQFGQHVWSYTVMNLCFTALLICLISSKPSLSLFSLAPLVALGRISYGVYVFHWAVLVYSSRAWRWAFGYPHSLIEHAMFFTFFMVVLLTVAAGSYRFFESPFLALKDRIAPNR